MGADLLRSRSPEPVNRPMAETKRREEKRREEKRREEARVISRDALLHLTSGNPVCDTTARNIHDRLSAVKRFLRFF